MQKRFRICLAVLRVFQRISRVSEETECVTSLFAELNSHPILFQRQNCPHEVMETINRSPLKNSPTLSSPVAFNIKNQQNEI